MEMVKELLSLRAARAEPAREPREGLGRAMIFEPAANGHHLQYVRTLIHALHGSATEIVVILSVGTLQSREFQVHLAHLDLESVTFVEEVDDTQRSVLQTSFAGVMALRSAIRRHRPDRVYVPYGDGLIQILGLFRSLAPLFFPKVAVELLIMRGGFAYPYASRSRATRHAFSYTLISRSRVDVLHVLDPLVFAEIKRRGGAIARAARIIPEAVEPLPAMTREEARARLGVPLDGRYLVCAGALDSRKGVGHLLRAVAACGLPRDVKVLLVGREAPELRGDREAAAHRLGEQLIVVNRYASEEEFGWAIVAADVLAVPYPEHQGSSGLLVRAAVAGRFALASDYGWVGWATQTFQLGIVTDVTDPKSLQRAVLASLERSADYRPGPAAQRFLDFHTARNQRAHWRRGILESVGANAGHHLGWEQVIRPTPGAAVTSR